MNKVEDQYLQMLGTTRRWTSTERIGIDCVPLTNLCDGEIEISATFLSDEMLNDLTLLELLQEDVGAISEFELSRIAVARTEKEAKLKTNDHIVVWVTVRQLPTRTGGLIRSEILLGPLTPESTSILVNGNSFPMTISDGSFDRAFSANLSQPRQGYLFFPKKDEKGDLLLSGTPSMIMTMRLPEGLHSSRTELSWTYDLVSSARSAPAIATATPNANATATPSGMFTIPEVDPDLVIAIVEAITAIANASSLEQ